MRGKCFGGAPANAAGVYSCDQNDLVGNLGGESLCNCACLGFSTELFVACHIREDSSSNFGRRAGEDQLVREGIWGGISSCAVLESMAIPSYLWREIRIPCSTEKSLLPWKATDIPAIGRRPERRAYSKLLRLACLLDGQQFSRQFNIFSALI